MEKLVIVKEETFVPIANAIREATGTSDTYNMSALSTAAVTAMQPTQSDWNENDESSKAYIKNRPFYTTDLIEYKLYDGTYTFSEVNGLFTNSDDSIDAYNDFKEGQEITFIFDGEDYSGNLKNINGVAMGTSALNIAYLGNSSLAQTLYGSYIVFENVEDTGEPFVYLAGMSTMIAAYGTEHTIFCSVAEQDTIQIPEKYIPLVIRNGEKDGSIIINSFSNKATGYRATAEGSHTTASGSCSHAEGYMTTSSSECAHAEGKETIASGWQSHAEGMLSVASGEISHAEGEKTIAEGFCAHAEGFATKASGYQSHAEGTYTFALQSRVHAEGDCTIASSYAQHVQGKGNIEDTQNKYAHIVGNGSVNPDTDTETDEIIFTGTRSNAHTLDWSGNAVFAGAVSGTGADYAEHFEWLDGNPDKEDRVGMVVTLEGDKIRKANADDEVLGIVSGTAMVIGDNAEWEWHDKFMTDNYGRVITEMVEEFREERNLATGIVERKSIGFFPHRKVNPEWDENKAYTCRSDRPEWDVIGLLGKLYVNDDGTCIVGGYATNADNGIITASTEKTNMRVMKRITDNIVLVFMK